MCLLPRATSIAPTKATSASTIPNISYPGAQYHASVTCKLLGQKTVKAEDAKPRVWTLQCSSAHYTDTLTLSDFSPYKTLYRLHSVWLKFLILKKFQCTYNQHQLQLQFTHLSTLLAVFSNSHGLRRHGDTVSDQAQVQPPSHQGRKPDILVTLLEKPQILLPIILVSGWRHDHLPCLSTRHFSSSLGSPTVR